jgi:CHAT domain-containing protein
MFFPRGMLKDGMRPAAALRAAQVEMMKQKRWASPYFWAAFVLKASGNNIVIYADLMLFR